MPIRVAFVILFMLGLSACSSGSEDDAVSCTGSCTAPESEVVPEKTTRTIAASGGGLSGGLTSATYEPRSGTFTVRAPGLNAQMNRFSSADYRGFLAMRDAAGIHNAYLAQGQGTQVVVYSGGTAGNVRNIAGYERTGASELPLNGTARFDGDYAGFTSTRRINGKVQLDVDCSASKMSGRITDRVFRQRPDNVVDTVNPLSTLFLEETKLNGNGSFRGVTGGGQITNGQILWNPATGDFSGLIGGANGDEAVGTVAVTHRAPSGATFDEIGGFLATR